MAHLISLEKYTKKHLNVHLFFRKSNSMLKAVKLLLEKQLIFGRQWNYLI